MTTHVAPGRRPLAVPRGRIELAAVTLSDGARRLVVDASLDLPAGSITHVLGCSPDEQSALLRLLLGERPTQGSIRLDGSELADLPLAEAREQVAVALSDPWLTAGSIADNIAFGHPGLSRDQIDRAARLARVDTFTSGWIDGLDTVVSEQAPELTVGQRRLVALARAVVRQPAVLLVQEPTKGLDAQEETLVIKALHRVANGRTTVVAAERLHYARRPDRQLRFERGRIVEDPAAPHERPTAPSTDRVRRRASRRHDATRSAGATLAPPATVPGYETVRLVERSSYTETWEAWDEIDPIRALIKLPRRLPVVQAAREELAREFDVARSLRHPGLVRPGRAALHDAIPHAVYDHVTGNTLAELIALHGSRLSRGLVLRVGYELARTLSYVHRRGYVHLDLRPEVIVVSDQGTVITDLKMARPVGTVSRRVYRRDEYGVLPAEQLRGGEAATSMDAFALGAVLYQAATGTLAETADVGYRPTPVMDPTVGYAPHRPAYRTAPESDATTATATAESLLTELIERLTSVEPDRRPTTEEVMGSLRRHVLPPLEQSAPIPPPTPEPPPPVPAALRDPLPSLSPARARHHR